MENKIQNHDLIQNAHEYGKGAFFSGHKFTEKGSNVMLGKKSLFNLFFSAHAVHFHNVTV